MLAPHLVPRFELREIARALDTDVDTIRKQIERGQLRYTGDSIANEATGTGRGRPRLLSANRAFHIALTYEIAGFGIPISEACRLALKFTDQGGEPENGDAPGSKIVDGPIDLDAEAENIRLGGYLFAEGTTGLIIFSDRKTREAQVIMVEAFFADARRYSGGSYLLINCNKLQKDLFQRLGFPVEAAQ